MSANEVIGLIIVLGTGALLIGLSIPLLMGKGTWLIAGYNTMSQEEKARWDGPALAKFTGKVLLIMGLSTALLWAGMYFGIEWLIWVYTAALVGLAVFAAIYCNTAKRFKK